MVGKDEEVEDDIGSIADNEVGEEVEEELEDVEDFDTILASSCLSRLKHCRASALSLTCTAVTFFGMPF